MKISGKYRFSLQWGADCEEKVRAGDFLERLGNRKSEFIIMAVNEYLKAHPEAVAAGSKLQIIVNRNFTRDQIREMILAMVEERFAGAQPTALESADSAVETISIEPEIDEMLKNLEMFES